MIDEKKIQEAAAGMFNVGGLVNTVERMAFKRGVDWFKKALWHDTSETPEEGKQILYTATEGGEIVDVKVTTTALYDFIPWNEVVRNFNISKWCYIEDLLPNK
jgi:hypothetical protein|nr:MAG TPA: hypothetical protein [Caudoviricetes sp.]